MRALHETKRDESSHVKLRAYCSVCKQYVEGEGDIFFQRPLKRVIWKEVIFLCIVLYFTEVKDIRRRGKQT